MSATNSEIIGIGTDIIELERIAHVLERHGQSCLDRILTQREQEYCARYLPPVLLPKVLVQNITPTALHR
jgi:phosphopantetheinyl transferase (holo-ACP synthase)